MNIQVRDQYGVSKPFDSGKFPGGEVWCRFGPELLPAESCFIYANLCSSDEVMLLLMVTDALRRKGAKEIHLRSAYLPYARQDRVTVPGESHSLKVFSALLNTQGYASVEVWDVHSDVALATVDNIVNTGPDHFLDLGWLKSNSPGETFLVAPDAGSIKKVQALSNRYEVPFVRADKTRDPVTGRLSGTVVYTEHVGKSRFLIVDDICDGGRTFLTLGEELRKFTEGKVELYVTHGIFSAGTQDLAHTFDNVYVANLLDPSMALPTNFHVYPETNFSRED